MLVGLVGDILGGGRLFIFLVFFLAALVVAIEQST